MRFARYVGEELEGKADADEWTGEVGEKAVVVAFAASESVACAVECHAGDDGEVDGGEVGEECALALDDGEGSLVGGGGGRILVEFEMVTYDGGKEHSLGLARLADEGMGADFIGKGVVEQYGGGSLIERMGGETVCDGTAHLAELVRRVGSLCRANESA